MLVALRRRAAGQGDQMGFGTVIQLPVPVGLNAVFQCSVQPIPGEAPLGPEHRGLGNVQSLGHPGSGPDLISLEQDAGPGRNPGRTPPRPYRMLQMVAFFWRQPDRKFLPDHTATSQQT